VQIAGKRGEVVMNVLNIPALKVLACGVVAAAVTAFGSYAFVSSTSVVKAAFALVPTLASTAAPASSSHLAQAGTGALLQ
jgi:hypothetical protein